MKKFNAVTLAEMLIAMAIVGILIGLFSGRVMKQMPDIEKTLVKKSYIIVEKTIFAMVNNQVLYQGNKILRNLDPVITSVGDQFGTVDPKTKFRDAFKYYVSILDEDIECDAYSMGTIETCFRTTDGVVYGIPNTNFSDEGVVEIDDAALASAREEARLYVPITIYPRWKDGKSLDNDSVVIGVRFDGKIKILNTSGCTADSDKLRCKMEAMLDSDDIKKND